jgi:ferritin
LIFVCKKKDYTTHNFLQWYVSEQIEEESLSRNVLDKLKLIGADKGGIYFFDRDLGAMAAATAGEQAGGKEGKA